MGRILVLAVLSIPCLFAIERTNKALSHKKHRTIMRSNLERTSTSCFPGEFYKGSDCFTCFCNERKKRNCKIFNSCNKANGTAPKKSDVIHAFVSGKLNELPTLPSKGAKCNPGKSYRVDCNHCLCLKIKSLMCENRLCPSYDDFNRLKVAEMSGKPCNSIDLSKLQCIKCSCKKNKLACKAKLNCVPAEDRHDTKLLWSQHRDTVDSGRGSCRPGKVFYRERNNKLERCSCSPNNSLVCVAVVPRELPFDEAFLDRKSKKKCTPGVVYRRQCNKCLCNRKRSVYCTTMECLKPKAIEALKETLQKLMKIDK